MPLGSDWIVFPAGADSIVDSQATRPVAGSSGLRARSNNANLAIRIVQDIRICPGASYRLGMFVRKAQGAASTAATVVGYIQGSNSPTKTLQQDRCEYRISTCDWVCVWNRD